MHTPRKRSVIATLALTLLLANTLGCGMLFAWLARPFEGDRKTNVEARYNELNNQRVAVMVALADRTRARYPHAREVLTKALSRDLAANVKAITLMNPQQILTFQDNNKYWQTLPYSQLIDRVNADRIVLVDVVDYQTHTDGNRHVYRGTIKANVSVINADAKDPDQLAFNQQVRVQYPKGAIGAVQSDEQTIEAKTVKLFQQRAGGLFYDHQRKVQTQ